MKLNWEAIDLVDKAILAMFAKDFNRKYATSGLARAELLTIPNLFYHHAALRKGYCSKAEKGTIEAYQGRFGKGFIYRCGNVFSNNFETINYYIFEV
jgi:hypothetical protein